MATKSAGQPAIGGAAPPFAMPTANRATQISHLLEDDSLPVNNTAPSTARGLAYVGAIDVLIRNLRDAPDFESTAVSLVQIAFFHKLRLHAPYTTRALNQSAFVFRAPKLLRKGCGICKGMANNCELCLTVARLLRVLEFCGITVDDDSLEHHKHVATAVADMVYSDYAAHVAQITARRTRRQAPARTGGVAPPKLALLLPDEDAVDTDAFVRNMPIAESVLGRNASKPSGEEDCSSARWFDVQRDLARATAVTVPEFRKESKIIRQLGVAKKIAKQLAKPADRAAINERAEQAKTEALRRIQTTLLGTGDKRAPAAASSSSASGTTLEHAAPNKRRNVSAVAPSAPVVDHQRMMYFVRLAAPRPRAVHVPTLKKLIDKHGDTWPGNAEAQSAIDEYYSEEVDRIMKTDIKPGPRKEPEPPNNTKACVASKPEIRRRYEGYVATQRKSVDALLHLGESLFAAKTEHKDNWLKHAKEACDLKTGGDATLELAETLGACLAIAPRFRYVVDTHCEPSFLKDPKVAVLFRARLAHAQSLDPVGFSKRWGTAPS